MRTVIARRATVALPELPRRALPAFLNFATDDLCKVHALEARPFLRLPLKRRNVELAAGMVRDHGIGRPQDADAARESTGVDAGEADLALARPPLAELCARAKIEIGRAHV